MPVWALRTKEGDWQVTFSLGAPDVIVAPIIIRSRVKLGPDHAFVDSTFRKMVTLNHPKGGEVVIYEEVER